MDNQLEQIRSAESGSESSVAWTLVVILAILLIFAIAVIFFLANGNSPQIQPATDTLSSEISLTDLAPVATVSAAKKITLDKEYSFPIFDATKTEVGKITFTIKDIERTKEVEIAGGMARATAGREILIVNAEFTNSGNLALMVNSRDYLRLKVNNQEKLLAPEFHGDPLDLQPQSTRETRLGFSVAETDRDLILLVGELQGEKEVIDLGEI